MQNFIKILGTIGIDPWLLLAQVVNFALLLWVLNRFLYKPVVEKIENDEKELQAAKILKDKLTVERERFSKQMQEETAKNTKVARERITEAEEIAAEIKKNARKEAKKDSADIKKQLDKQTEAMKKSAESAVVENERKRILQNMVEAGKKIPAVAMGLRQGIDESYLNDIETRIAGFPKETFEEENPSITLETASPANESDQYKFRSILGKRFEHTVKVNFKTNPDLILGYRLEINGLEIENNLYSDILHAVQRPEQNP